jgi:uncharacterized membrane protein
MLNSKKSSKERDIHILFEISVALKGLHALMEIIGGFLILWITKTFIIHTVLSITQEELSEDPKDFIANYLINSAQHFSISAQHFAAFYLLSHGLIKGLLVVGLLKKKLWAYPSSMIVFSFFILYQLVRFISTHSMWLIVLTILDIVVLWLIWHEYKFIKRQKGVSACEKACEKGEKGGRHADRLRRA